MHELTDGPSQELSARASVAVTPPLSQNPAGEEPVSYLEVTVIYDDALEGAETFISEDAAKAYLTREIRKALNGQGRTEFYVMYHDHPLMEDDCSCIQYLQSHKPKIVIEHGQEQED